jgi:predicted HicB family RNase H-like nuclease
LKKIEEKTATLNVRGVPHALHQAAKVMAAKEGITLTELVIRALKVHTNGKRKKV